MKWQRYFTFLKKGAYSAFFFCIFIFQIPGFAASTVKHHVSSHIKTKKHLVHKVIRKKIGRSKSHSPPYLHSKYKKTPPLSFQLTNYRNLICANAEAQLGKNYLWGGVSPKSGFDCSGFSQYVYKKEGITIPRTALQQYMSLTPTSMPEPGDLVFFRTEGSEISHVGIYLGDGYFIHSPHTGAQIRVSNLNSGYWKEHYAGARRAFGFRGN